MALAGLRLGEMRALTWGDVSDLAVSVSKSAGPTGEIGETKTKAGNRHVPMSAPLRKLLAAWRLEAHRSTDDDLVIGTWSGKPVSESAVRKALAAAVKEAKLGGESRLSCHSLRHSYASRLALGGLEAVTLARVLGHTDPSFTMRVYCSDQRSVADVAADVLKASAV